MLDSLSLLKYCKYWETENITLDQKSLGAFSHHFYAKFIFNIIYLSSQNNGEPCFVVSQQTGHKKEEKGSRTHIKIIHKSKGQGRKKPRSNCPGQVNFDVEQVKIEIWWPNGQVKLALVVLWVCLKVSAWWMIIISRQTISKLNTARWVTQ